MTSSEFLATLEQVLDLEPGTISRHESLCAVGWWESMAVIMFMAVADQELHVSLTGAQIQNCRTVPELLALLGDKITDANSIHAPAEPGRLLEVPVASAGLLPM
jgi:hypothetical protein